MKLNQLFPILLAPFLLSPLVVALDSKGWKQQSIYQLLTDRYARSDGVNTHCNLGDSVHCGGDYRGIINNLDYIQGMGFTAIWISPIVENLPNGYHGYHGISLTKFNTVFGSEEDLMDLSRALHSRGMYLMIDIFINHVAIPGRAATSNFVPPQAYFPFTEPDDFHPFCWIKDYDNQTESEQCWLGEGGEVALADINTEKESVVRELYASARMWVDKFEIDGLRVDTVKHVRKSFWPGFQRAAGTFCIGEVLHGDPDFTGPYQGKVLNSVFDYPTHFSLVRAFSSTSSNLFDLRDTIRRMHRVTEDASLLGTFLDNHDLPRFTHKVKDSALRLNAMAFPFVADGFPVMYSGSEQDLSGGEDPFNREPMWWTNYETKTSLYPFVARLNAARKVAIGYDSAFTNKLVSVLLVDEHDLVLLRGPLLTFLTNRGSAQATGAVVKVVVPGLQRGDILVDVLSSSPDSAVGQVVVGKGGLVKVIIREGKPRVFLPLKAIKGERHQEITSGLQQPLTISQSNSSTVTPTHRRERSWARGLGWLLGVGGAGFIAKKARGPK